MGCATTKDVRTTTAGNKYPDNNKYGDQNSVTASRSSLETTNPNNVHMILSPLHEHTGGPNEILSCNGGEQGVTTTTPLLSCGTISFGFDGDNNNSNAQAQDETPDVDYERYLTEKAQATLTARTQLQKGTRLDDITICGLRVSHFYYKDRKGDEVLRDVDLYRVRQWLDDIPAYEPIPVLPGHQEFVGCILCLEVLKRNHFSLMLPYNYTNMKRRISGAAFESGPGGLNTLAMEKSQTITCTLTMGCSSSFERKN